MTTVAGAGPAPGGITSLRRILPLGPTRIEGPPGTTGTANSGAGRSGPGDGTTAVPGGGTTMPRRASRRAGEALAAPGAAQLATINSITIQCETGRVCTGGFPAGDAAG